MTDPQATNQADEPKLEAPAKEGYEAFVGVDPEYRNASRDPKLTEADVAQMKAGGLRTDAERVRAINNNTVLSFAEAQGIEIDETDEDVPDAGLDEFDTPVENDGALPDADKTEADKTEGDKTEPVSATLL